MDDRAPTLPRTVPGVAPFLIPLLALLFVLSGAAGLVYESIWSRYLGLFVGHSAYAQIVVLVIFLGGMSLGAVAAGRWSERIREPLKAYAWIEAGIGLLGLVFHPVYVSVTERAYDSWFPALAGTPWLALLKWGLAGGLILPQSVLLGATFPLMTAGVLRRAPRAPGAVLGLLYFANSFGAAIGVLLSGFWLVGAAGLPGTVTAAGILNLVVAVAVLGVVTAAGQGPAPASAGQAPLRSAASQPRGRAARAAGRRAGPAAGSAEPPGLGTLLLVVAFGTGLASFVYEVAWIRMLSLVLGSAAHSFEVMLSAFILGLALGSLWVRSRADRFRSPMAALGILQWAMGSLALATLPLYLASFHWMSDLILTLGRTEEGYRLFTLARYGICLAVMLPATFCAGTTLPLITRSLIAAGSGERAIGVVYGVNTLGSILGAGLAGLVLMPLLGLKGLMVAGALLDIALGVAILLGAGGRQARLARAAVGATALLVVAIGFLARFDLLLLTSGVYRFGLLPDPDNTRILSYRHGRTASISIERYEATRNLTLSSNGKADASVRLLWLEPPERRPRTVFREDEATQVLIGLLTLAHAPGARAGAVIGHGSGMTTHTLLGSPRIERVTTIEIEPEVFRAARAFLPANRRAYEDPRSEFAVDDAKSFFASHGSRYDVIVSEPSHPWVSGVAGLFSAEFHRRVSRHLTADGVFGQWLHLYELNDDLALSVLAAIHRNFRFYEVFLVDDADMLIVATNRASGLEPDWGVVSYPGIAADLAPLPPFTPGIFEAMRVGSQAVLGPLAASVPPNSDYFPVLERGAEKARYLSQLAAGFLNLHAGRYSLTWLGSGRRVVPIGGSAVPTPEIPRVQDLAFSAALRLGPTPPDPAAFDSRLPQALARKSNLQQAFRAATAPADWRAWTFELLHAEDDWHRGTAGVVDEGFYALARSHLSRTGAPPQSFAALEFVHDLAVRDFPAASRRTDSLLAWAARGEDWLPPEVLLEGGSAARLLTGDREGARAVADAMLGRSGRSRRDLRTLLLESHLAGPAGSR